MRERFLEEGSVRVIGEYLFGCQSDPGDEETLIHIESDLYEKVREEVGFKALYLLER